MPRVAVLAGDGIGPEITAESVRVLSIVRPDIELVPCLVGGSAIDAGELALPRATVEMCESSDAILLGAVGGPQYDALPLRYRPEGALLELRRHFGLYANFRPVRALGALACCSPLRPEVVANVDLVIVRELTGGLYFGKPKYTTLRGGLRYAVDTMAYDEAEIRRVSELAFVLARRRRGVVLSVDKSNVLETSRLWRAIVTDTHKRFQDVRLQHMLVDSAAMHLLRDPGSIDVLLTENTFGDILSDEAAMLVGSLGALPSASVGRGGGGLFEPISGSAPDIAGKNRANPIGSILSAAMLLELTYGDAASAQAIRQSVDVVLSMGLAPADLARANCTAAVGTKEFGDAVCERLEFGNRNAPETSRA